MRSCSTWIASSRSARYDLPCMYDGRSSSVAATPRTRARSTRLPARPQSPNGRGRVASPARASSRRGSRGRSRSRGRRSARSPPRRPSLAKRSSRSPLATVLWSDARAVMGARGMGLSSASLIVTTTVPAGSDGSSTRCPRAGVKKRWSPCAPPRACGSRGSSSSSPSKAGCPGGSPSAPPTAGARRQRGRRPRRAPRTRPDADGAADADGTPQRRTGFADAGPSRRAAPQRAPSSTDAPITSPRGARGAPSALHDAPSSLAVAASSSSSSSPSSSPCRAPHFLQNTASASLRVPHDAQAGPSSSAGSACSTPAPSRQRLGRLRFRSVLAWSPSASRRLPCLPSRGFAAVGSGRRLGEALLDQPRRHQRLHLARGGAAPPRRAAEEALGLGAVLGDERLVVLLADLADAALELQVLERAEDGALLLLLGARRAERVRVGAGERRLAHQRADARPEDGDHADQRARGQHQHHGGRPLEHAGDHGADQPSRAGQAELEVLRDLLVQLAPVVVGVAAPRSSEALQALSGASSRLIRRRAA